MSVEMALIEALHKWFSDLDTGPLSDTPYVAAEVETDGALSLVKRPGDWADASIDVPQIVHALMAEFDVAQKTEGQGA